MIALRKAHNADIKTIFEWRNRLEILAGLYQQSRNGRKLTWEEHLEWWNSRPEHFKQFIVMLDGRDIGYVNIQQLDYWSPEIAIVIGESSLWGQGIGRKTLNLALDYLEKQGYEHTHTTILNSNTRSRRLFRSVGYRRADSAREGESYYSLKLKRRIR